MEWFRRTIGWVAYLPDVAGWVVAGSARLGVPLRRGHVILIAALSAAYITYRSLLALLLFIKTTPFLYIAYSFFTTFADGFFFDYRFLAHYIEFALNNLDTLFVVLSLLSTLPIFAIQTLVLGVIGMIEGSALEALFFFSLSYAALVHLYGIESQQLENEVIVGSAMSIYLTVALQVWESQNLFEIFLALELSGICLFTLLLADGMRGIAASAGTKYLIQSTLAGFVSVAIMFEMLLEVGSLDVNQLVEYYTITQSTVPSLLLVVFLFKLSLVPFHAWTPEIYGACNKRNMFLFGIANKILALHLVLVVISLEASLSILVPLVSMLVGAIGCLKETSIKRFFAYSTIANVGFAFIPVALCSDVELGLEYLEIYFILNLLWFAIWVATTNVENNYMGATEYFTQLKSAKPIFVLTLSYILVEFSGLPPSIMFDPKFSIGIELFAETNSIFLSLLFALSVVILAIGYMRVITLILFNRSSKAQIVERSHIGWLFSIAFLLGIIL